MCLDAVYSKKQLKEIKKQLTERGGWITVYRVVSESMRAVFWRFDFKKGLNKTPRMKKIDYSLYIGGVCCYAPYFHSWTTEEAARIHLSFGKKAIKCKVRPSWITAIGTQSGIPVIVSRKIMV